MINIPPKYSSGLPQQDLEPVGNIFERLNLKIKYEQENIKPLLKELFPLYGDHCLVFWGEQYLHGEHSGMYKENREADYQKVGEILAKM